MEKEINVLDEAGLETLWEEIKIEIASVDESSDKIQPLTNSELEEMLNE